MWSLTGTPLGAVFRFPNESGRFPRLPRALIEGRIRWPYQRENSDAGPVAFDMKRERNPGVRCSDFVRCHGRNLERPEPPSHRLFFSAT
jgi:hypothetical protein